MSERTKARITALIVGAIAGTIIALTVIATVPMIAHTLEVINDYWGW